ncbi:GLPGLI family protein [Empedobacter falsenii]|uniref:GLPGLI family protein n=1 Tax=Empedobacter falsenii TaxID=343874 RepID=UPI0025756B81|nr:GLPGLI family protein [Empedobacter falsenii]MDM1297027.1 GLPGLI family protein [Empedobacter falsenii]MDM1316820.1 GLPGLI family protein [Empedobacter falsenii]
MLKYLFLILPLIGFAQDAVRVEYEIRQEFENNSEVKTESSTNLLRNSANRIFKYELLVNNSQSNFVKIEQIDNSQNKEHSLGLHPMIGNNYYKKIKSKELFEQSTMDMRTLIKDTIQSFPWVLSKEESTILGYKVRKATYTNNNQTVEAWYAPDLLFRDGPSRFNGLPGLILKVKFKMPYFLADVNNTIIINATKIDPYTGKIELPKNAKVVEKEVSQEKAQKLFEKQKELRSQGVEKD